MIEATELDIKCKVHVHNGTFYINLPKKVCKKIGLCHKTEEEIRLVIHELWKEGKIITLCDLRYKE